MKPIQTHGTVHPITPRTQTLEHMEGKGEERATHQDLDDLGVVDVTGTIPDGEGDRGSDGEVDLPGEASRGGLGTDLLEGRGRGLTSGESGDADGRTRPGLSMTSPSRGEIPDTRQKKKRKSENTTRELDGVTDASAWGEQVNSHVRGLSSADGDGGGLADDEGSRGGDRGSLGEGNTGEGSGKGGSGSEVLHLVDLFGKERT